MPLTYEALRAAYQEAEDAIHELGLDTGEGVELAAVNQLRYAGNHVLRSVLAQEGGRNAERDEEMQRALRHCERALYDAYDAAVFFRLAQFQQFQHDYRAVPVTEVIPTYPDIRLQVRKARDLLRTARSSADSRGDFYRQVREIHATLAESMDLLDEAREELNKRNRRFWVQPLTSFLAAALGAGAMVLARWLWPS